MAPEILHCVTFSKLETVFFVDTVCIKTIHCCGIARSGVSIRHWRIAQTTKINDSLKSRTSLKNSILLRLQEEKQQSSNSSALAVIFTLFAKHAWHLSACANAQNDNSWHHQKQLMWKLWQWWLRYQVYNLAGMHLDSKYKVNLIFFFDKCYLFTQHFSRLWFLAFSCF